MALFIQFFRTVVLDRPTEDLPTITSRPAFGFQPPRKQYGFIRASRTASLKASVEIKQFNAKYDLPQQSRGAGCVLGKSKARPGVSAHPERIRKNP
jgi:hypothetical protein